MSRQRRSLDRTGSTRARAAEAAAPARRAESTGGQGKDDGREREVQREKRLRGVGPLREESARIEEGIAQLEQVKKDAEAQLADPGVFKEPARSTAPDNNHNAQTALPSSAVRRWVTYGRAHPPLPGPRGRNGAGTRTGPAGARSAAAGGQGLVADGGPGAQPVVSVALQVAAFTMATLLALAP